jgi:nucleoside-diphosphate-sugar epimerase
MRILITGASGFVGRAVAQHLILQGHDVVALVRNSLTAPFVAQTIEATLGSDNFVESVQQKCREPAEAIIHTAARIDYQNLCQDIIGVNCLGLQQILSVALHWNVQTFINFSSIGVIGLPIDNPITEGHSTSPRTAYHASKLFGEHFLEAVANHQMAAVSLRMTAPVGQNMPATRILPVFLRCAIESKPLTLSGRGTRRQNYVDIRDVIYAVALCLEHRPRGRFNLGGPYALSNLELASLCIQSLNSNSKIEFDGKSDPADNEIWEVCLKAAKDAFHYTPAYDIRSTITDLMTTALI